MEPKKQSNTKVRQISTVILYGGLAIAMIFILIFIISTNSSKKMICEAPNVNITISYNDSEITGYSSYGMGYDLEGQREYAQKVGLEAYFLEFESWFKASTENGVCHR